LNIYLNTNIYGRPYDDLKQRRILDEAIACLRILVLSFSNLFRIIGSEILLAEIGQIKDISKKEAVEDLVVATISIALPLDDMVINIADGIYSDCSLEDYADCLHLAFAFKGDCKYFLSCDDGIISKSESIQSLFSLGGKTIRVMDSRQFLKEEGVL